MRLPRSKGSVSAVVPAYRRETVCSSNFAEETSKVRVIRKPCGSWLGLYLLIAGNLFFSFSALADEGKEKDQAGEAYAISDAKTREDREQAKSLIEMGLQARQKGTIEAFKQAFDLFTRGVELGACDGYAYLGDLYLYGQGVERSTEKAIEQYEKGIEFGNPIAMNFYAVYLLQTDREENYSEAIRLTEKSAELGYRSAQMNIATFRINGLHGLKCDSEEGARLLFKSAAQEFPPAFFDYGFLLCNGIGVPRDLDRGLEFYKKAIDVSPLLVGQEIARLETEVPELLAARDFKVMEIKMRAYAQAVSLVRNKTARYPLRNILAASYLLENGLGGPIDQPGADYLQEKANELLLLNIERNEPYSLFHYGLYLLRQDDEEMNDKGRSYIKKAGELNFTQAQQWLKNQS